MPPELQEVGNIRGLNKPATVTMYHCSVPDEQIEAMANGDQRMIRKTMDRVKNLTRDKKGILIHYSWRSGIWTIQLNDFNYLIDCFAHTCHV